MMLFMIVCIFWLSLCVVVLLYAPYVIIGMMHVSTSFHIIVIFSPLKFLSFAMWSIVWYAASTFPSSIFMWSSRCPLLLMISPRYLSVSSRSKRSNLLGLFSRSERSNLDLYCTHGPFIYSKSV